MLAIGTLTRLSGIDATLGLAFAATGVLYPFFGALLGWLGVALTGSDTASNVLFGNLQKITSEQLGLSPILMSAANSSGGVMGKMIDAQSIVVASTATNWFGHEGTILALRVLPLDRARLPRRCLDHAPGLCVHRHDRALSGTRLDRRLARDIEADRDPRVQCVLAGGDRRRFRARCRSVQRSHRNRWLVSQVLGDPGHPSQGQTRSTRVKLCLAPCIGDRGLAGSVERRRGIGH